MPIWSIPSRLWFSTLLAEAGLAESPLLRTAWLDAQSLAPGSEPEPARHRRRLSTRARRSMRRHAEARRRRFRGLRNSGAADVAWNLSCRTTMPRPETKLAEMSAAFPEHAALADLERSTHRPENRRIAAGEHPGTPGAARGCRTFRRPQRRSRPTTRSCGWRRNTRWRKGNSTPWENITQAWRGMRRHTGRSPGRHQFPRTGDRGNRRFAPVDGEVREVRFNRPPPLGRPSRNFCNRPAPTVCRDSWSHRPEEKTPPNSTTGCWPRLPTMHWPGRA